MYGLSVAIVRTDKRFSRDLTLEYELIVRELVTDMCFDSHEDVLSFRAQRSVGCVCDDKAIFKIITMLLQKVIYSHDKNMNIKQFNIMNI